MEEFEYALDRGQSKVWFIVDANFGILERDLLIAQRLRKLLEKKDIRLVYFASKGNRERVLEIAKVLSPMCRTTLIGIQSLDNGVLKAINRRNIDDDIIKRSIKYFKSEKIPVKIDLIMGLPQADKEIHISDFRKAFKYGFDHIEGFALRLLPSSEIAGSDYRKKYKIETGFRPVSGLLGVYNGKRIIEFEENVISTKKLTVEDYHFIRVFYWMIWFGYNMGFLKVLFDLLMRLGKNPADFIDEFLSRQAHNFPPLDKMINNFYKDSKEEWFPSIRTAEEHYKTDEAFERLIHGQRRLNTKYFATLIYDNNLRDSFMQCLKLSAIALFENDNKKKTSQVKEKVLSQIKIGVELIDKLWIKFQDFSDKGIPSEETIKVKGDLAEILAEALNFSGKDLREVVLYYPEKDFERLKGVMEKFEYKSKPILAIEKIILANYGAHLIDNLMQYKLKAK
ncbi:MAG: hypothetical protein HQL27_05750 [Candidatus Omnitrophica bacterium]|nr:hypothetical protein [Candidatus Omnitrophota bacterium]